MNEVFTNVYSGMIPLFQPEVQEKFEACVDVVARLAV